MSDSPCVPVSSPVLALRAATRAPAAAAATVTCEPPHAPMASAVAIACAAPHVPAARWGVGAAWALALVAPAARPQYRIAKLTVPTATAATNMGQVALGAHELAVGAPGARALSGAVFVFQRATGTWIRTVSAPAVEAFAGFGAALAIEGGTLAIGAPESGDGGGAGLFDVATGSELFALSPGVITAGSRFGAAMAIDAEVVAVGAPGDYPFPPDDGVVHLFDRHTGAPLAAIPAPDPTPVFGFTNAFGSGVALEAGRLLVGAPGTGNVGAAYVYDVGSASLLHRLEPPLAYPAVVFGFAIDLGAGRVAVGDPSTNGGRGAAHVYDAASGAHLYSVVNAAGLAGDGFGTSVALDGERLVVGAIWERLGESQGVVRVFDVLTGRLQHVISGFPAAATQRFGGSLDLHQGQLAVGDPQDSEIATYAGAAYLITFQG